MKIPSLILLMSTAVYSETLKDLSDRLNKELPETYDPVTKLMRTTAQDNHLYYHFKLIAEQSEFNWAMPKVKAQVLKTICSRKVERQVLRQMKASIVYRYVSVRGLSLGEFMVTPQHCL